MDFKAVIFDLDGVLVFTDRYHYLAWKEIAEELGIDFSEKDNDKLRGVSRAESLEIILEKYDGPALSDDKKAEILSRKNGIYREYLQEMSPADVSMDVRDTLYELKKRGVKIAVGSSSKNTSLILEKTGLAGMFDAVADGTMITRSKPDPEVFLKAAELIGMDPDSCLVVEDADAGVEAAKAAGMHSAAIGAAVKSHQAEFEIDKISDILN